MAQDGFRTGEQVEIAAGALEGRPATVEIQVGDQVTLRLADEDRVVYGSQVGRPGGFTYPELIKMPLWAIRPKE